MNNYENQENQNRDNGNSRQNENATDNQNRNEDNGNKQNQDSIQQMERNWEGMKQSYRQQYPQITDEDVNFRSGEFDTMTDRIAQRTGRKKHDVHRDILNWSADYNRK